MSAEMKKNNAILVFETFGRRDIKTWKKRYSTVEQETIVPKKNGEDWKGKKGRERKKHC
jgi:hypothetical protein